MKRLVTAVVTAASLVGVLLVSPPSVLAAQDSASPPSQGAMPSEVPASFTPAITGDNVQTIAAVGNQMLVGGPFSSVAGTARSGLAAFNSTTGALNSSFNPSVAGTVLAVLPGPVANTVYVAGKISAINGTPVKQIALLNTLNGSLVSGFTAPAINGQINSIKLRGDRLYLGGVFTKVGTTSRGGLATLNPTTGSLDPFLGVSLTERHNNTGSGAKAAVGASVIDVSPDGSKMMVVGNFRKADGLDRVQAVLIDLTGSSAAVKPDWRTTRYVPLCFSNAFDTYMRGLSWAPNGEYFVITATGGPNQGTLCDAAARFEANGTGLDVQPTWVTESGGDTLWSTTITDSAVFVGGHQRWMNNPLGGDSPRSGAVPRPGLVALDPLSGRPLSWNPGRNPRGVAVFATLATDQGLWIGYNTDWIGPRKYKRQKIAFFPYAGGTAVASTSTANLPATVFLGHGDQGQATNVLYRVNTGGATVQAIDNGPDWSDDSGSSSPYRNSSNNAASYNPGAVITGSVPASTPPSIFDSERWDPSDSDEMGWNFTVPAGTPIQVRLYLANRCECTNDPGERIFDVSLDGNPVLNKLDLSGQYGDQRAVMRAFDIVSDGNVDIDFGHVLENPLVNGIEIIRTDVTPGPGSAASLDTTQFDGSSATTPQAGATGIDWTTVRGAFAVGDYVYFGKSNSTFWRAAFNGSTIGTPEQVDPYHDAKWMNVSTGSGQTYDGATPSFYGQIPNVGGMFYSGGRLYYNQVGSSSLYSLWFSPDSGIVDGINSTVPSSMSFSNVAGMFEAAGHLYFVDRTTGDLNKVAFAGGIVSGSPQLVTGPSAGGFDWRARALFAGNPLPNQLPTATFASMCTNLECSFDSSGSTDSDGSLTAYNWSFGDGTTDSGATVSHTFSSTGNKSVTLKVRDNTGGESQATRTVDLATPAAGTGLIGETMSTTDAKALIKTVTPSGAMQVGDTMLLTYTGDANVPTAPAGWTLRKSITSKTLNLTLWSKVASAPDLSQDINLTQKVSSKAIVGVSAYRGFRAVSAVDSTSDVNSAMHAAPSVPVTSGDQVVSVWSDKSSTTTGWTEPVGQNVRAKVFGAGNGRVSYMLADRDARQSTGLYPEQVATTNAPSSRGASISIVLTP